MKNHLESKALDRLNQIGGQELSEKIIQLFLEKAPHKLSAAKVGVDSGDLKIVESLFHSLKSSAANVGAVIIQDLSQQIETLAENGNSADIPPLLEELTISLEIVRELLEKKLGRGK